MLKPDQPTSREFQSLRNSAVQTFLVQRAAEVREMLVWQRDADAVRTLQGQAQLLAELMTLIDGGFSTNGKRG